MNDIPDGYDAGKGLLTPANDPGEVIADPMRPFTDDVDPIARPRLGDPIATFHNRCGRRTTRQMCRCDFCTRDHSDTKDKL